MAREPLVSRRITDSAENLFACWLVSRHDRVSLADSRENVGDLIRIIKSLFHSVDVSGGEDFCGCFPRRDLVWFLHGAISMHQVSDTVKLIRGSILIFFFCFYA